MTSIDDISYSLLDSSKGKLNVTKKGSTLTFNYPCVSTITCTPYVVNVPRGVYRMFLWGAQGGSSRTLNKLTYQEDTGGRGAFVSGKINILRDTTLHFYVGGKGEDLRTGNVNAFGHGGFNGGGNGGYDVNEEFGESNAGGGGASDIRLIGEDNTEGYKSRIIVAGAGGSRLASYTFSQNITDDKGVSYLISSIAGDAGALEGFSTNDFTIPGTQTTGCFGKGNHGVNIDHVITQDGGSIGGGGGGYYGGDHISISNVGYIRAIEGAGAGGSSFVSGCRGCNAVSRLPINQVVHTKQSIHYSGYKFFNIVMKSGKDQFNTPDGISETGHHGNGAISITYISKIKPLTCHCKRNQNTRLASIIILVYMP